MTEPFRANSEHGPPDAATGEPGCRLFVYGTLRRGFDHRMARFLADQARHLGEATVMGTLVNLGSYPAIAVPGDTRIVGDVYEFPSEAAERHIAALDAYEGCGLEDPRPHEYRREAIRVTLTDGTEARVWSYLLNGPADRHEKIPGGDYLAWLAERRS